SDLCCCFFRLKLEERLLGAYRFSVFLEPAGHGSFGDRFANRRNLDFYHHDCSSCQRDGALITLTPRYPAALLPHHATTSLTRPTRYAVAALTSSETMGSWSVPFRPSLKARTIYGT